MTRDDCAAMFGSSQLCVGTAKDLLLKKSPTVVLPRRWLMVTWLPPPIFLTFWLSTGQYGRLSSKLAICPDS